MPGLWWSLLTILSWGVWLAPLELAGPADERRRTLMITLGNLGIALIVAVFWGFSGLTAAVFWPALLGGLVWAWSGIAAVIAVQRLGIAKAMGVWAPLNILTSLAWGMGLFGEMLGLSAMAALGALLSVGGMIGGILLIVFASDARQNENSHDKADAQPTHMSGGAARLMGGLGAALIAGVGWGSYFIPIRLADASPWVAAFPLAVGMVIGAAVPLMIRGRVGRLSRPTKASGLAIAAGLLWALGNYGSLQMMEQLGTGRGFALAQSCVVVNALLGIFLFHRPRPRSRAARQTLLGIIIASASAAALVAVR